jgi:hypothetical protein
MKLSPTLTAIATVALFSIASVAQAEQGRPPAPPAAGNAMYGHGEGMQMEGMKMDHGTSTGTSTMKHEMPKPVAGVLGKVTTVGSNSFTMDARLKDATTSITVNVMSSTTYRVGSTTGSFSSITSGLLVGVEGRVSTSTNTINAVTIFVLPDLKNHPMQGMDDHHMASGTSTSTPMMNKGGVIHWLKGIIMRKGQDYQDGPNGEHNGAAAAAGAGFGSVLHAIFGWL